MKQKNCTYLLFYKIDQVHFWLIFSAIYLITSLNSQAQESFISTPNYSDLKASSKFILPSNIQIGDDNIVVGIYNKSNLGKFTNANNYSGIIQKNIKKRHTIGLQFHRNKDGDFLNTTKVYLNYAVNIPLSETIFLSGGLDIGYMSVNMLSNSGGAGGSAGSPDLNLGVSCFHEKWAIAGAYRQTFENTIRPIDYNFELNDFFEFVLSYKHIVKPYVWEVNPQIRYTLDLVFVDGQEFYLKNIFFEKLILGYNYQRKLKQSFWAGAKIPFKKNIIADLIFAYNVPMSSSINTNTMEIIVLFHFLKNKN